MRSSWRMEHRRRRARLRRSRIRGRCGRGFGSRHLLLPLARGSSICPTPKTFRSPIRPICMWSSPESCPTSWRPLTPASASRRLSRHSIICRRPTSSRGSAGPEAMTIDQATHDLYVNAVGGGGKVYRYETGGSAGAPKNFTAGPAPGTNTITGLGLRRGRHGNTGGRGQLRRENWRATSTWRTTGTRSWFSLRTAPVSALSRRHQPAASRSRDDGSVYVGSYEGAVYKFTPQTPDRPARSRRL